MFFFYINKFFYYCDEKLINIASIHILIITGFDKFSRNYKSYINSKYSNYSQIESPEIPISLEYLINPFLYKKPIIKRNYSYFFNSLLFYAFVSR